MHGVKWSGLVLSIAVALGAVLPASAQEGTPPASVIDGSFDVGGRSLYLRCTGSGSPTVILEAGDAPGSEEWLAVQPEVANVTRVCSYDRAGRGMSDPPPAGVRTSQDIVTDLEALLAAAGVDGPYVLVGSTVGTLVVQHFARLHPETVVGLVLMGPIGLEMPAWVEGGDDPFWSLLPEAQRAEMIENQRAGWLGGNPDRLDILASLDLIAALPPAPIVPAVVVVQGQPEPLPATWPVEEMTAVAVEEDRAVAAALEARVVVASGAVSFDIPTAEPAVVVQAILNVVEAARNPASWTSPTAATPTD
jgi:pimeloyl-ACP methyl ester carboxylesterase